MIKDIEEESKTKFSIKVEFSFSFKEGLLKGYHVLRLTLRYDILILLITDRIT